MVSKYRATKGLVMKKYYVIDSVGHWKESYTYLLGGWVGWLKKDQECTIKDFWLHTIMIVWSKPMGIPDSIS